MKKGELIAGSDNKSIICYSIVSTVNVFIQHTTNSSVSTNHSPSAPLSISPENKATDVDLAAIKFSWIHFSDDDVDDVTYKICVYVSNNISSGSLF